MGSTVARIDTMKVKVLFIICIIIGIGINLGKSIPLQHNNVLERKNVDMISRRDDTEDAAKRFHVSNDWFKELGYVRKRRQDFQNSKHLHQDIKGFDEGLRGLENVLDFISLFDGSDIKGGEEYPNRQKDARQGKKRKHGNPGKSKKGKLKNNKKKGKKKKKKKKKS